MKKAVGWIGRKLRRHFFMGILIVLPVGGIILLLVWFFMTIDNVLQPLISSVWGVTIPGVGFGITVVLIYVIGLITDNIVGRKLIRYGESLVTRIPIVRLVYSGIKNILQSFSEPRKTGFMQVVLVEFPRKGMKAIGFITNESSDESGKNLFHVFIPTSPNPTSGFLQIMTDDEIVRTKIRVDDALKLVVSAGRVLPKKVSRELLRNS